MRERKRERERERERKSAVLLTIKKSLEREREREREREQVWHEIDDTRVHMGAKSRAQISSESTTCWKIRTSSCWPTLSTEDNDNSTPLGLYAMCLGERGRWSQQHAAAKSC